MHQPIAHRSRYIRLLTALAVALLLAVWLHEPRVRAQAVPIDGTSTLCDNFIVDLFDLGLFDPDIFGADEVDITDEGWVYVEPSGRRFRSVSGRVVHSGVARNDLPANHDSHDQNANVVVDPGQEDILSVINGDDPGDPRSPDTIELEWETGIRPSEKNGDGANPTFPKWAWPSHGDRVWANGNWVLDCGHSSNGRYRSEIHPPRAIATMRDQAGPLPGTGGSAVPITATDLYIHGRGGYLVQQLNCDMSILITGEECAIKTTPIAENFVFDVCLPPRPAPAASATWAVEDGPGNTVGIAPQIAAVPAAGACLTGAFDHQTMLRVLVPLGGSGVSPNEVYARHINAGWLGGAQPQLRHLRVTLKQMDLHEDHELDPGDGELTFLWMNVNRSDREWIRLSDFANGNMNDYDDDGGLGDGEMNFTGATFDFYVRDGQSFTIRAIGYEQDCYEDGFGSHEITTGLYIFCHSVGITGNNDAVSSLPPDSAPFSTTFGPADSPPYGIGTMQDLAAGDYELEVLIEEIPPVDNAAPVTLASASPGANANGWNNTNVTVTLASTDNDGGSGVKEILVSASGAQPVPPTTVAGASAAVTATVEGITTIEYQARDNAGNLEAPKTLTVRIDRTAPVVTVTRAPGPNANGWNNTDVVAQFAATDALSGIDGAATLDVVFTLEGANQGATRTFADRAGNTGAATIGGINIDKTPPVISGLPQSCVLAPPNHRMVEVGTAVVTDALSGVAPGLLVIQAASNEPVNSQGDGNTSPDILIAGATVSFRAERAGGGDGRVYTVSATAQDLAGNVGTAAGSCRVPKGR